MGNYEFDKGNYPYSVSSLGGGAAKIIYTPELKFVCPAVLPTVVAQHVVLRLNSMLQAKQDMSVVLENINDLIELEARKAIENTLIDGTQLSQVLALLKD